MRHALKLDRTKLKLEISRTEARLRALKVQIKDGGPINPWDELLAAKAHATLLYAISAQSRGRQHFFRATRRHEQLGLPPIPRVSAEEHTRWIGDRWSAFADTRSERDQPA